VVFPLLLRLLRRTARHHGALLVVSGIVQVAFVSAMHWDLLPWWMRGFWASREITSYQFYLVAGLVVAVHLDDVHDWLLRHVRLVVGFTVVAAALAEVWYFLSADQVVTSLGSSSDPFQPIVIPFNIGAIACIYLIGVALVDRRRSNRTRVVVQSGSDNSYGVFLAQMIFITALGWLGWQRLDTVVPWPLVCVTSAAIVFMASAGLTALLARTPVAKALTGRSRVRWGGAVGSGPMWSRTPRDGGGVAGDDGGGAGEAADPLEPDPVAG
jgi:peptidoglycan/LPS O-acetylase OafA/YrhL